MFYFDSKLENFEENYCWDDALTYLENRFHKVHNLNLLNSLIGLSWFCVVEGPMYKSKFNINESELALSFWKKYIDLSITNYYMDPFCNFISGYTLLMDGFILGNDYENKGVILLKRCFEKSKNIFLKLLADNILLNVQNRKYVKLDNGVQICRNLFKGNSILDKYFRELYS